MNIEIFTKVFNHKVLNSLIFKQVHHIFIDILYVKPLKWKDVLDSPYYLAGNGYLNHLKEFYQRENDNRLMYRRNESVLLNSLKSQSLDIIKYIIEDLNYNYNSFGCYRYDYDAIGSQSKTKCEDSSCDLLTISSKYGNLEIIKYIDSLKYNQNNNKFNNDISWDYVSAFTYSPVSKDWEVVQYLYSKIIENDLYKQVEDHNLYDAVHKSLKVGRIDFIEWIFSKFRKINLYDLDLILAAVVYGARENVEYCMKGKDLVDSQEFFNGALITEAAVFGHLDIIQWLISNKIDILTPSAINGAFGNNHIKVGKWLIESFTVDVDYPETINGPNCLPYNFIEFYELAEKKGFRIGGRGSLPIIENEDLNESSFLDIAKYFYSREEYKNAGLLYKAAEKGYLEAVKWIVENSTSEVCSSSEMKTAAYGGHLDIIKFLHENCPKIKSIDAIDSASIVGNLDIIKWLHENRTDGCTSGAMDYATEHLEVIKWLHENRTEGCTTDAMEYAALYGKLEVLKWLHENRTEGCTANAMDNAAERGNLEIVKWLHENRTEGCTTNAMDKAARNGNLEIVKYLHENRTEGCTAFAMHGAICSGYFEVVKWLHENRTEGCTDETMDYVIELGNLSDVIWLHENRTEGCTEGAMENAIYEGSLDIIKWLHENRNEGCTSDGMDTAARRGNLNVLKWLHHNRTEGCTKNAMNFAALQGHLHIIKWLHENRAEGCTTDAMDYAAMSDRNFEIIKWLHENRTEGCTSDAMDKAAYSNSFSILKWLHNNRTEGCTTEAMDQAIEEDHFKIVKWLHENRTEGCTANGMDRAAYLKHWSTLKWLLLNTNYSFSIDAIKHAVEVKNLEILRLLLSKYNQPIPISLEQQIKEILTSKN